MSERASKTLRQSPIRSKFDAPRRARTGGAQRVPLRRGTRDPARGWVPVAQSARRIKSKELRSGLQIFVEVIHHAQPLGGQQEEIAPLIERIVLAVDQSFGLECGDPP